MTISIEQVQAASAGSGKVYTSGSDRVGGIGQFYLDNVTGDPKWVTVKTGLFGTKESFVPLEGGRIEGDDVYVNYDEARIKDAPRVDPDGELTPEEESRLYAHYGLSDGGYDTTTPDTDYDATGTGTRRVDDATTAETTTGGTRDAAGTVGRDTSGPTTDSAMTRSEEQLHVGTRTEETGRARLRKYVVTENVTQTVPVSREEVRVEREPITDANAGDAYDGPAISEEEHEVVLHEERPVVEKEAVPVERVRLDTETVTEQQTVSDEVRKEQIDVDDAGNARRGDRPV